MRTGKTNWPRKASTGRGSVPAKSSFPPAGQFIIDGISAINEYLRFNPERVEHLVAPVSGRQPLLTERISVNTKIWTPEEWDQAHPEFKPSSAIWASVRIQALQEDDLFVRIKADSPTVIVALDHVTDPRNLGAIARTCGFFGIKELLVPHDRQVHLTGASVSTAQGAFALVDLVEVTNLGRTLEKLKADGYWIVAADMIGEPISEVAGFYDKTILVFGSEGAGISPQVLKKCDRTVAVVGSVIRLESLNVSVAAGIVIREFCSIKSSKMQTNKA